MNSFRGKIINLREVLLKASMDTLCVDKTKLNASFPNHQSESPGYQFPPLRRDRNFKVGGEIVLFVRVLL